VSEFSLSRSQTTVVCINTERLVGYAHSSVQLQNLRYVSRSLIIKIMTAALTRSSYVEAMQRRARTFLTGWWGSKSRGPHFEEAP